MRKFNLFLTIFLLLVMMAISGELRADDSIKYVLPVGTSIPTPASLNLSPTGSCTTQYVDSVNNLIPLRSNIFQYCPSTNPDPDCVSNLENNVFSLLQDFETNAQTCQSTDDILDPTPPSNCTPGTEKVINNQAFQCGTDGNYHADYTTNPPVIAPMNNINFGPSNRPGTVNTQVSVSLSNTQTNDPITLVVSDTNLPSNINYSLFTLSPATPVKLFSFYLPAGNLPEGNYWVNFTATDTKTNLVDNGTLFINVDMPTSTISINGGTTYTTSPNVYLTTSAVDGVSGSWPGIQWMEFSNDSITWLNSEEAPGPVPEAFHTLNGSRWQLSPGDGVKTLYFMVQDTNGYWSAPSSSTIILDTTGPTGSLVVNPTGNMVTNNGATYTNSTSVTLTVLATDAISGMGQGAQMEFCNDNAANCDSNKSWVAIPYSTNPYPWTLSSGDGPKTVYAKFENAAGNWSAPIASNIVNIDTTSPTVSAVQISCTQGNSSCTPSPVIFCDPIETNICAVNNGVNFISTANVTLDLYVSDTGSGMGPGAQMELSNDGTTWSNPMPYSVTASWALSSGDGSKIVYARFSDALGNWTTVPNPSASIVLDTTPPTGTIVIKQIVGTSMVNITLSAKDTGSGVANMQLENNGGTWTNFQAYTTTINNWTLFPGSGTKTVYVKFINNLGNASAPIASNSITIKSTQNSSSVTTGFSITTARPQPVS